MQIVPSETYKELLKQFKSLLQMYNRQEEMFLIQQKKLSDTKVQLAFITQIMDDMGEVIPAVIGGVVYQDEQYSSIAELLHSNVGVEFGEGEDNDSTSIEEAIANILAWEDLGDVINQSHEEFSAVSHFTVGRWIRNQWGLWQQEGGLYEELKGLGLTHADDMSGYLLTLVWCTYHDRPFNGAGVISRYKEHWENYGK